MRVTYLGSQYGLTASEVLAIIAVVGDIWALGCQVCRSISTSISLDRTDYYNLLSER